MIEPTTELAMFREMEHLLKENTHTLLMKEVFSGCPCANNKKMVYINNGATRLGYLLEKLELLRCG